jgi:hypothetical protein
MDILQEIDKEYKLKNVRDLLYGQEGKRKGMRIMDVLYKDRSQRIRI